MIASIVNNTAYSVVVPTFAIIIGSIWAAIVIALHVYLFAKTKSVHGHETRSTH
jgi:hypothetical protein